VKLTVDTYLAKDELASITVIIGCKHFGDDLYVNRLPAGLPILFFLRYHNSLGFSPGPVLRGSSPLSRLRLRGWRFRESPVLT